MADVEAPEPVWTPKPKNDHIFVTDNEKLTARIRTAGVEAITLIGDYSDIRLDRKYLICLLQNDVKTVTSKLMYGRLNIVVTHPPERLLDCSESDAKRMIQDMIMMALLGIRRP